MVLEDQNFLRTLKAIFIQSGGYFLIYAQTPRLLFLDIPIPRLLGQTFRNVSREIIMLILTDDIQPCLCSLIQEDLKNLIAHLTLNFWRIRAACK